MKTILAAVLSMTLVAMADSATTSNATNAYSWGANVGWTNWQPSYADFVLTVSIWSKRLPQGLPTTGCLGLTDNFRNSLKLSGKIPVATNETGTSS